MDMYDIVDDYPDDDPVSEPLTIPGVQLPAGIHLEILGARDVVTGGDLRAIILWADRTTNRCPRCYQPIELEPACPVQINPGASAGGQVQPWSQQHGCGEWLSVAWTEVDVPDDDEEARAAAVNQAAAQMAAERTAEIDRNREQIRTDLRRALATALDRLGQPLDGDETMQERIDEIATGSETNPGVCRDGDTWLAWEYDPVGGPDPITVHADDKSGE